MNTVSSVLRADQNETQGGAVAWSKVIAVVLWVLLGIVVMIIAFVLVRRLRSVVAKNRNKRYRRDRRRSR